MAEFINTVDVIGDEALTNSIIDKSVTEYKDNVIDEIGEYAFYSCSNLTTVDFPAVTTIGQHAFDNCTNITSIDFPAVTEDDIYAFRNCSALTSAVFPAVRSISQAAFYDCPALTSIDAPAARVIGVTAFYKCTALTSAVFPAVTGIQSNAFKNCTALRSVDFPAVTSIGAYVFQFCYSLTAVILRSETVCRLDGTNTFEGCYHILGTTNSTYNPTGAKDGYIYVPRALIDSYKSATYWSTYASQLRVLEDYTDDGTTTGALDESKI